jgi:Uma2 family endonuclease
MPRYTITIEPGSLTSADEYANLPDEPGWRTELTNGRVVRMPAVKDLRHGWVIDNLVNALSPYVRRNKLGGITYQQEGYDITLPGDEGQTIWQPDLAFLRTGHIGTALQMIARGEYVKLAPDLVVEVISPSQTRSEANSKAQRWLAAGTRLVWNIWIDAQQVDVWQPDSPMHTLSIRSVLDGLEVVPDFTMPIADLFIWPAVE